MKVGDLVRQIGWEGLGIVTVIGEGRYRITTVFWTDRGENIAHHFFEDLELISECR